MMSIDLEWIAKLEWTNYAAQLPTVQATLGINLAMREKSIVLTSVFPTPDVNHACLLRATPESIDGLIDETIQRFKWNIMPPRVFTSPACSPPDLEARLLTRGFAKQEEENETWMTLEDLDHYEFPPPGPDVSLAKVTKRDILTFSRIFTTAFDMPGYFTLFLALLLRPSIELPGFHHYIASVDGNPLGICSMIYYESFGILGSVGVVPKRQGGRVATSLLVKSVKDAQLAGINTIILQTASNSAIVRRLRLAGFKAAFTRSCYVLR